MSRFEQLANLRIERVGTIDQVARHLRAMISDGRLRQGERLPEIPLAEALGVSRNTLRDAIRVLAAEGLVLHELHRGAVVRTLSAADIADIYEIRRMLELKALPALPLAPEVARARIWSTLAQCEAAFEAGDYGSFIEHELEFHGALVAVLGSERLDRFFGQVLSELRLLFGELTSDNEPRATRHILGVFQRLVRAAEKGDFERATKLMGDHLDAYEKRLVALVGGVGAGTSDASPRAQA
ncbi:MAG TPA: GntR family transcriptional regulator [Solirubrobacteraceae bacterium]|jgi:DNA-binding GntR family transcriptional regulator|nr:GntR family transcriptional regulator [Solirubrobacteraceae bacterium]